MGHYDTLAEYDAVVLGVADCTLSAWWAAYHAKMIESRGTPVVVLTHTLFEQTLDAGGIDNGFTGVRRAVIDPRVYSLGFTRMTATSNTSYLRGAFSEGTELVAVSVYNQVKTALTAPLTAAEAAPPAITAQQFAGWTSGNPEARTFEVSGLNEVRTALQFNKMAMDLGFGDGLPLVMPVPELVDEMLAGSTRGRNEVLGRVMPRGGVITVEKVAINAVMAGARPEYFPVILAAMEGYASSWEEGNLLYHALTSSDNYALMLLVSGPLVEELGISGQWGYVGSGNEANNAIGRAVKMSIRNIGLNRTHVTDGTARYGRQNDHAMIVFGEQMNRLPRGWEPHSEMMGFAAGQSTVTLHGYLASTRYQAHGGVNSSFVPQTVLNNLRARVGRHDGANIVISTIPRSVAGMAQYELNMNSKYDLWQNMETTGAATAQLLSRFLFWPIVVGDPDEARTYTAHTGNLAATAAPLYGTNAFRARLIGGATQTVAGRDATTPGTPQNLAVVREGTSAVLTWSAPERTGGAAIVGYQVSMVSGAAGGASNPAGPMLTVPVLAANNPAVSAGSAIPQAVGAFAPTTTPVVPAWINVPEGATTFTITGLDENTSYVFHVRAISDVRNALQVTGSGNTPATDTRALDYSASGRGAWASLTSAP